MASLNLAHPNYSNNPFPQPRQILFVFADLFPNTNNPTLFRKTVSYTSYIYFYVHFFGNRLAKGTAILMIMMMKLSTCILF